MGLSSVARVFVVGGGLEAGVLSRSVEEIGEVDGVVGSVGWVWLVERGVVEAEW